MAQQEMPIFTRTFDLLAWLLPAVNNFPRAYRHSFTQRMLDAAFDLSEALQEANLRYGQARSERLIRADESLDKLRHYLRLAARLGWLKPGQYEHVAVMSIETRLARLRLTIHPQAQPRAVSKGISFLGFRLFPDHRRLKRRNALHFRCRLHALITAYADGDITLDKLNASVQGWVNHARYGNTIGLRKATLTRRIIPAPKTVERPFPDRL